MAAEEGAAEVASLQVPLSQMLDLALGTPEVGAVNLNILHSFLRVLLKQINLESTMVEFQGENADRIKTMVAAHRTGSRELTTIVQEAPKTTTNGTEAIGKFEDRLTNLERTVNDIEQTINNLQIVTDLSGNEPNIESSRDEQSNVPGEVEGSANEQSNVPGELEGNANEQSSNLAAEHPETAKNNESGSSFADEAGESGHKRSSSQRISISKILGGVNLAEMHEDVTALKTEMSETRKLVQQLDERVSQSIERHKGATKDSHKEEMTEEKQDVEQNVDFDAILESMEAYKEKHENELQNLNDRIGKIEREVSLISEQMKNVPTADEKGANEMNELVSKIQGIQADMERLNETADHLIDDRENREMHLNALLEQIEMLKTIKADKEDLEDALADKADAQVLNRKVSHDQFDAACDDLTRGLEDAITKLGKQEAIWQEALDEVQKEIESKVDKIEISPLKEFVNNKLKNLQEKLKSVAEMRQENEAAGSKKLLKDVQCISCDKNVVMRTEEISKFRVEPLPCTVSMKPYLTYELDQVRKQQKKLPQSRNMIQFEAALQEESKKQKPPKAESLTKTPRDHLCNRYCGGSHTVTTPHQRVMRMGHFLNQWGPETVQLTEGTVRGTDGRIYRSRRVTPEVCGIGCGESNETRPTEKPPSGASTVRKQNDSKRNNGDTRKKGSSRNGSKEPSFVDMETEQTNRQVTKLSVTLEETASDRSRIELQRHTDEVIQYDEDEMEQDHDDA